jgi:ATP-dependent Clp protease adaptor protein ClpS
VADTIAGVDTDELIDQWAQTLLQTPWITIVWNDPVNLMNYVEWVFRTYFGFDKAEAKRRMLQVHNDGRAVVATGTREEMERHVNAMHGYGLWATLQKEDEA